MTAATGVTATRRYAFVGTGHRAELFFGALLGEHRAAGRAVALCDTNPGRMAYYQDLHATAQPDEPPPVTYAPEEFEVLLERERPDVVVVTSPDSTHHRFIAAALARGCDVVVEKPLTTDVDKCRTIVDAVEGSAGELVVTFNYRYSPRNAAVKQLLADGAIGKVTSVHFEWLLDTIHGADYFRRWHRDKHNSGGLLVHKSTHHFDLVNWWLDAVPSRVHAEGELRFYGEENARDRGLGPRPQRSTGTPATASDPFALDLTADPRLRRLYLEAEQHDGYIRDRDVFGPGITIEDNAAVLVRYADRALLTYSLNAHAPWEGYRVAFNGTAGRLELDVVERAGVEPVTAHSVVGRAKRAAAVDPSAGGEDNAAAAHGARTEGNRLLLQRHWEPATVIPIPAGEGGHGGGDAHLLDDVFRGAAPDPLRRRAGYRDGLRSVLVGIAANRALETGLPVDLSDFGLPIEAAPVPFGIQEEVPR